MSRGAPGRGGRGGGRGRGRGSELLSSTGHFSYEEIRSGMTNKSQSSVYPTAISHAITPIPQLSELSAARAQLELLQQMKLGAFWPSLQEEAGPAGGAGTSGSNAAAAERKGGQELPRYSDRYRPQAHNGLPAAESGHTNTTITSSTSTSTSIAPSFTSLILQREVFPQILWRSYMSGEERREALRAAKASRKRTRAVDWSSFEGGALGRRGGGAEGEEMDEEQEQDGEGEEELDAYEDDEDEGDYAAEEYFDDGDGDDEDALDSYGRGGRGGGNADGEYD